ncbi:MAG: hypothetical protein M9894_27955 [Planctomycetes bacterium]|nr:hypothetical protein [Planctomycetota bacterium]
MSDPTHEPGDGGPDSVSGAGDHAGPDGDAADGDQVLLDLRPSAGKPRDLAPGRTLLPVWWPCCFMGGLFALAMTLMTLGELYKDDVYPHLLSPEDRLSEAGSLVEVGRQRMVEAERTGSPLALEQALHAYERALRYVPDHPPALEGIARARAALGRGPAPQVEAPEPERR